MEEMIYANCGVGYEQCKQRLLVDLRRTWKGEQCNIVTIHKNANADATATSAAENSTHTRDQALGEPTCTRVVLPA
jgi:hypothetical protein